MNEDELGTGITLNKTMIHWLASLCVGIIAGAVVLFFTGGLKIFLSCVITACIMAGIMFLVLHYPKKLWQILLSILKKICSWIGRLSAWVSHKIDKTEESDE